VADQQLVFEQTIEGLFVRAVGSRMTPRLKQRLREAGVDLDRKLLPAYPFGVWMQSLKVGSEELFPGQPPDVAQFQLGELFIEGYRETFLGRAVLGMIRVLGPRRTLRRSTQNFRSGNNYTETKLTEVDETCSELWMNEVGPYPSFTAGIIHGALVACGVTPTVEMRDHDGHACTYRISWGAAAEAKSA